MKMEIQGLQPKIENEVCLSGEEVLNLINENIRDPNIRGAYVRIFGKDESGQYIIDMIMDKKRILAIECTILNKKEIIHGEEALKKFVELSDLPLVATLYPLDNESFKMVLAKNIEVFSKTPAIPLQEIFKREAKKTIEGAITEAREAREKEIKEIERETEKIKEEKEIKIPEEITINVKGDSEGKVKEALMGYINLLKGDINRQLKGAQLRATRINAEIGKGTVSLIGEFYITANDGNPEVLKRRALFLINKHIPKIMKSTNLKPIIKDLKVNVVVGEVVTSMEEREREDTSLWKLTKPPTHELAPNLHLTIDPKFKQYFTGFARTLLKEIEDEGIIVDNLDLEILGGVKEFEINIKLEGKSKELDEPKLRAIISSLAKRHASELSKIVGKYIWINNVTVELKQPTAAELSAKAAEILKKKKEIEKEVEKMLKEAGIEELSYLLEDKKREIEKTVIKPRIDSAMETLRKKLQENLKSIPNANLRWINVNHEPHENSIEISVKASLAKVESEGLFGVLSTFSEEEIKRKAIDTIVRTIREVEEENQIQIKLKRLDISVR